MRQVICIGIGLILIFVVMPYALFVAATFMIAMPAYHDVVTWIDYLRLSFFPALSLSAGVTFLWFGRDRE